METQEKIFTPSEANCTLPLVKRIVEDILEVGNALRAIGREANPTPKQVAAYQRGADELKALFAELESLGCSYKDWNFEIGLVDFPARIDGRNVLLCWRSDEPRVEWYHAPEAGFAGRQRIPEALLEDPLAAGGGPGADPRRPR